MVEVSFETDKDSELTSIDAVIVGLSAEQLNNIEKRIDNYYDANGLSSIEVNGNCIAMIFETEDCPVIASIQGYICDLVAMIK